MPPESFKDAVEGADTARGSGVPASQSQPARLTSVFALGGAPSDDERGNEAHACQSRMGAVLKRKGSEGALKVQCHPKSSHIWRTLLSENLPSRSGAVVILVAYISSVCCIFVMNLSRVDRCLKYVSCVTCLLAALPDLMQPAACGESDVCRVRALC